MRGDGMPRVVNHFFVAGSPPHARGRPGAKVGHAQACGITPACAGTAYPPPTLRRRIRDHPRMRGDGLRSPLR